MRLVSLLLISVAGLPTGPVTAQSAGRASGPGALVEREAPEAYGRNILILVADDLGVDSVGAYGEGNDRPPTPNIDQLAETGVLFRNAWSQATCSPTRAALQTGLRGYRSGIGTVIHHGSSDLDLNLTSLPEMLDLGTARGYSHAAIGKWHLANQTTGDLGPNLAGYEHFSGTMGGQLGSYSAYTKVVNGAPFPEFNYATSEVVDDALEWIALQSQPWMCYVAFQAPHAPFHRPPDHLHTQALPPGEPRTSCADASGVDPRPFFKAMVEAMDTEIGRLIDSLPAAVRRDTTIVFMGDNGTDYCLGVPPFDGPAKSTLYEGGVNVPLIVWGAHVPRAGESSALVQATDIFATVAELAGVDLQNALPGELLDSVSMVPYFGNPELRSIRKTVVAEIFNPNGATDFTIPPCISDTCQSDVGFGTLDGPSLSSCGPPLFGIYTAHLIPLGVSGAPPSSLATLRIGPLAPAFDPVLGAEVVSLVPESTVNFTTNAQGELNTTLFTGGLSGEHYYQFVFEDPDAGSGFAVSNAVRMELYDTRMFAVRDERFKLIHFSSCRREFYDLELDPFETNNLHTLQADPRVRSKASELYREALGSQWLGF